MDRFDVIKPYIKNKDVLDVGCVHDNLRAVRIVGRWLHGKIAEHAKHVIGIDTLEEGINEMKRMGYDVKHMNAEKLRFYKKFDVIVAGVD